MLRITDKGFQYTPSFSTDLKKRFRKMIRDQQRAAADAGKPKPASTREQVVSLTRRNASNS